MTYPENLFYTKDHEWIMFDGNVVTIGITDFAQKELGDIVYLDITTLNEHVESEQVFGTIEAVKTVSDLFMPVTGRIIEINQQIIDKPELINHSPYEQGWLVKAEVTGSREHLLDVQEYKKLIGA